MPANKSHLNWLDTIRPDKAWHPNYLKSPNHHFPLPQSYPFIPHRLWSPSWSWAHPDELLTARYAPERFPDKKTSELCEHRNFHDGYFTSPWKPWPMYRWLILYLLEQHVFFLFSRWSNQRAKKNKNHWRLNHQSHFFHLSRSANISLNQILGQTHEDHGAVGVQVIAEADLIATVHLDRRDVNPRCQRLEAPMTRHGLMGTETRWIRLVYGIAILIIILFL